MFFDDRLRTVLDGPMPQGGAARAQYFQLVDIIAQQSDKLSPDIAAIGLGRIHSLRALVSDGDRERAAKALSGRLKSVALLQYLAADKPEIASAAIASSNVSDAEMALIVPALSVRARGFLRARRDIGPETHRALARHGAGDMVLTQVGTLHEQISVDGQTDEAVATDGNRQSNIAAADTTLPHEPERPDVGEREIGKIVARIEALRKTRSAKVSAQAPLGENCLSGDLSYSDSFGFETDDSGTIVWTNGKPEGAICGINISRPAFDNAPGPDGYAAAAYRQRMPIEAARLRIAGSPAVAGSWRIDARPFFDRKTGRFRGYRGQIRKPLLGEEATESHEAQNSDAVRQLVHELRTPLGAILGFAEIIEQQLFGPVAYEYRSLATDIMNDAHFMLSGFEDLDTALKLDRQTFETESGVTEAQWLEDRISQRLSGRILKDKNFSVHFSQRFKGFALAPAATERMVLRLLSTLVSLASREEDIAAQFDAPANTDQAVMQVTLPEKMRGAAAASIFDPDFGKEHDISGPSLLGAGFSLRLVRNLARQSGGELTSTEESVNLTLRAVEHSEPQGQDAVAD